MIIGIGTDIVQIPRIEKILKKYDERFINKILTANEIKKMLTLKSFYHANYIAKRFAAKEAICKAFGSGIGEKLGFQNINIINNIHGKPMVQILNKDEFNNLKIELSLADDYPIAIAFTIISR